MEHAFSPAVTWTFAALLAAMILVLAFEEKLHAKKSLVTGVFAVLTLGLGHLLGVLPFGPDGGFSVTLPGGHRVHMPVYVPPVDWDVVVIILGSSLFVDATARSGLFTWIALRLTRRSGGDPLRLLVTYGLLTVIFSAVLNNVTAMIIVGSLTAVSLDRLERKDLLLGFLLVEGLLTNLGGLLTLISSVPNILVGAAAGIGFTTFFFKAAPYVAVATGATLWLGARLYRVEPLREPSARAAAAERVAAFDEREGIESEGFFRFASVALVAFVVGIAAASVLHYPLGMGFVAMGFGVLMLVRFKAEVDRFYRDVDWDLLLFFVFLFVVIGVMEHARVLDLLGEGLAAIVALDEVAEGLGTAATLAGAAAASAVTDNIPLAAMLARILQGMGLPSEHPLWWSVVFGANLGGNLTPIGSASTVVAVTLMHRHGVGLSFVGFVRAAVLFALAQIALAVLYVLFVVPWIPG